MSDSAVTKRSGPGANVRASDIVLDDAARSLGAKGVFVTIGLLGGSCLLTALDGHTSDGPVAVRAAVAELVAAGYVDLDGERVTINDPLTFGLSI
jgi:hypothetical protein